MLETIERFNTVPIGIRRLIAEFWIFHHQPDHVHSEAVHAAIQPKAHHVEYRGDYLWITIIQVWLLFNELVQVILLGAFIIRPGRTTKVTQPVVWRTTTSCRVTPQIPIALRVIAAAATFQQPRML